MPNKLANRVKMTVSGTPGTGTITLGSAVTGFTDFATGGVVNGNTVPYVIEDGVNWEIGVGTYSSTGPTLARTSITASNNSNAAISATANAIVMLSPLAADLQSTDTLTSGTLGVARGGTGLSTLTAGYIPFGAGTSAFGNSANLFWDSANTQLAVISTSATKSALDITPGSSAITMRLRARSTDTIADIQFTDNGATTAYANIRTPAANALSILTNSTERLRIDSSGNVGIGVTTTAGRTLVIGGNNTGNVNGRGIFVNQVVQSDVTAQYYAVATNVNTAAVSFTLPSIRHYVAFQGTIGAGSTVTNQIGFYVDSTLTGATNNYGFYSDIASSSARWNFFANGTANNAFAGNSRFGGTTAPVATVDVTGSVAATTTILSTGATSGIGYATGAGGAVTQATSRTTGVTLNKVSGQITLFSAAGSTTATTFTVTNSAVAATDVIHISQASGTNLYIPLITAVSAGSFNVTFYTTGGTATDAPVFNFAVMKAVAA